MNEKEWLSSVEHVESGIEAARMLQSLDLLTDVHSSLIQINIGPLWGKTIPDLQEI